MHHFVSTVTLWPVRREALAPESLMHHVASGLRWCFVLFPLPMHTAANPDGSEASEGPDAQGMMGQMLAFLHRVSVFCSRVNLVVKNVVHQLASLYSPAAATQGIVVKDVRLQTLFRELGRTLVTLITLDEIIQRNSVLQDHWTLYKR